MPANGAPLDSECVGPAHLWFDNGASAHLDIASDWTLHCEVFESGDDAWLAGYAYEWNGRWVLRDASAEDPFRSVVGRVLTSAEPIRNELGELIGVVLVFGSVTLRLSMWAGSLDTTPR